MMDKVQRWLSLHKFDIILDNNNKPVRVTDFVEKLKQSKKLKDIYLANIDIWINYFKKKLLDSSIEPQLIENKLSELLQIACHFTIEEWPMLYRSIKNMELLIN